MKTIMIILAIITTLNGEETIHMNTVVVEGTMFECQLHARQITRYVVLPGPAGMSFMGLCFDRWESHIPLPDGNFPSILGGLELPALGPGCTLGEVCSGGRPRRPDEQRLMDAVDRILSLPETSQRAAIDTLINTLMLMEALEGRQQ